MRFLTNILLHLRNNAMEYWVMSGDVFGVVHRPRRKLPRKVGGAHRWILCLWSPLFWGSLYLYGAWAYIGVWLRAEPPIAGSKAEPLVRGKTSPIKLKAFCLSVVQMRQTFVHFYYPINSSIAYFLEGILLHFSMVTIGRMWQKVRLGSSLAA